MRSRILNISFGALIFLLLGCPSTRVTTIKEIKSDRIPDDLRIYLAAIRLDSNFNFKEVDTSLFIAGRDGFTYQAIYKLSADSSAPHLNLMGYLSYTKSSVGYSSVQDKLLLNFSIINYCCSPHTQIHCAPTRGAAKDTTVKYGCTGWKVNVR